MPLEIIASDVAEDGARDGTVRNSSDRKNKGADGRTPKEPRLNGGLRKERDNEVLFRTAEL